MSWSVHDSQNCFLNSRWWVKGFLQMAYSQIEVAILKIMNRWLNHLDMCTVLGNPYGLGIALGLHFCWLQFWQKVWFSITMKMVWNDYCVMKLFVELQSELYSLQPSLWAVCPGKGSCLQWRKNTEGIEEYRLKQQFYRELSKEYSISFHKSHDQVRWKIWPQDNHPESFHQQSFQRHRHPMVKSVFAGPPANRIGLRRRSTWKSRLPMRHFLEVRPYYNISKTTWSMTIWHYGSPLQYISIAQRTLLLS